MVNKQQRAKLAYKQNHVTELNIESCEPSRCDGRGLGTMTFPLTTAVIAIWKVLRTNGYNGMIGQARNLCRKMCARDCVTRKSDS